MLARIALFLWMCGVIIAAFTIAPQAKTLGELARIIYFHVPSAWVCVLAFLWAMAQSILYLKNKQEVNDIAAESAARIGIVFALIATVTGMVFAKATWGSYWNWDPRELSVFVLLLIYMAYFALRMAIEDDERRARLSAVYAILAFFTVPFLVFVMPRLYFSLHPSPIIEKSGKLMDSHMRVIFISSMLGFTCIFIWMQNITVRVSKLARAASEQEQ